MDEGYLATNRELNGNQRDNDEEVEVKEKAIGSQC